MRMLTLVIEEKQFHPGELTQRWSASFPREIKSFKRECGRNYVIRVGKTLGRVQPLMQNLIKNFEKHPETVEYNRREKCCRWQYAGWNFRCKISIPKSSVLYSPKIAAVERVLRELFRKRKMSERKLGEIYTTQRIRVIKESRLALNYACDAPVSKSSAGYTLSAANNRTPGFFCGLSFELLISLLLFFHDFLPLPSVVIFSFRLINESAKETRQIYFSRFSDSGA